MANPKKIELEFPLFDFIEKKAKEAGTNITAICKKGKINRSTVERWKEKDPKTISEIRKILTLIEKQKAKA